MIFGCLALLAGAAVGQVQESGDGDGHVFSPPVSWVDPSAPSVSALPSSPISANGASPPRLGLAEQIEAITQGRVQLEGGYSYIHDRLAGVGRSEHLFPDLLLRVGITERLELRLGWGGYLARWYDDGGAAADASGWLDPTVGFMYDLVDQSGWVPQLAISAAIPVSMQSSPLASSSFQPLCRALYRWDLSDRWGLEGTTGLAWREDSGSRFWQIEQTVGIDYLLSRQLDLFSEWQMLVDLGSVDDGTQHVLSLGAAWAWSDRYQLSWRVGMGLNDRSPDFLTAIRFAVRF